MPTPAPTSARARRRAALQLAAVYAGALFAVVASFLGWSVHRHHASFAHRGFFWTGNLHQADATIGFRMRPDRRGLAVLNHGLHDPARRIPVRTDQLGFRVPLDRDSTAVVPGGLVAVGCSCTFAHGVAAESSYVALAGELLGLPAYNLGVCSYSAVTSLALLTQNVERLCPRWVVYGFANFHLERSGRPRADSDLFQAYAVSAGGRCRIVPPPFDNRLVFESVPRVEALYYEPLLAGRPAPLDAARLGLLLPLAFQDLRRTVHPAALRLRFQSTALPETTFCRYLLRAMHETSRAQGATFVPLFFPARFGETACGGFQAAVDELRGEDGFLFVDCAPRLFTGVRDQGDYAARWQVPRDGHPNRFMHLEMARELAAALAPAAGAAAAPVSGVR